MIIKYNNSLISIRKRIQGNCILIDFIFSKEIIMQYDQEFNNIYLWYLISNSTLDHVKSLWIDLNSKKIAYYNCKSTFIDKKCDINLINHYKKIINYHAN